MQAGGATTWYFPDGYLPEKTGSGSLEAHEALMVMNTGSQAVHLKLDFYFDERPPVKDVAIEVAPERCVCFRMDIPEHIGGLEIPPLTQYGVRVRADRPVVVQFARLDTTQANLAYYVNIGYCHD